MAEARILTRRVRDAVTRKKAKALLSEFRARDSFGSRETLSTDRGPDFCLAFLQEAQAPDGGWGYHPGGQNASEPTCWALLALAAAPASKSLILTEPMILTEKLKSSVRLGCDWLVRSQLPDGSWPALVGQRSGCWVTALACLALETHGCAPEAVARGIGWLCDDWPRDGGLWWRLCWRLRELVSQSPSVVRQNHSLRGWGWTPGTSSWVEPTSYALLLLRTIPPQRRSLRLEKRRRLGQAMLYDRMCDSGGWGCGSPLVYGVPSQPSVGPTVWALLALRENWNRPENQKSLAWLEQAYNQVCGPGSLALAHLCLRAYGRPTAPLFPALERHYGANQFFGNVPVVAWAAIALSAGLPRWLTDEALVGKQDTDLHR